VAAAHRPAKPLDRLLPIVELQYVDETGTKGATSVKYAVDTPYALMDAEASVLASLIAPITGCALVRQRIIYKAVASPRDVPEVGSTIKSQGVFFFTTGDETPLELIAVPGIAEGVISDEEPGAGVDIDLIHTDIIAFADAVTSNGLTNPFGDAITALVAAYRQSRA